MARLSYLLTLTPRETWRILRHRIPGLRGGPSWTVEELLTSSKHARGIRFAELLLRQERIVSRVMPSWKPIEFEGKRVVEVGCGPLAGYGPLAVYCGAATFQSAEPEWTPDLFFSRAVREKYLRILHADLTAVYGPRLSFDAFMRALEERMTIHGCGFEKAPLEGKADVVLSQSVIEHVFPLDATLAKLAEVQSPSAQVLHLVDFGNHYPTESPFEGLYDDTAEAYIGRRGRAINCLRMSDIGRLFAEAGLPVSLVPSRVLDRLPGPVHPYWRERYSNADLTTQLALVVNRSP